MTQIVLINPPIINRKFNFTYSVDIPLGLAYIAAYLKEKKVKIKVIDAVGEGLSKRIRYKQNHEIIGLSFSEIITKIPLKTDIIAISSRYTPQHNIIIQLIKEIKKQRKGKLVIGGNHASYHPHLFLDGGADAVLLGEGENTLYALSKDFNVKLPGIIRSKKDPLKFSEPIKELDSLPFPARDLFPLKNYWNEKSSFGPTNNKSTPITSSRGCPNRCSYCTSAKFWNYSWRKRSPENIFNEIKSCKDKFGITEFHFVDDNLSLDKKRLEKLCNLIINSKLKVSWGATNGLRPENLDYHLLKLMKLSGCNQITLAPESGSQRVLKEIYNKYIDLNKLSNVVAWCSKLDIKTSAYFIIGAIGETKKDRSLTKSYLKKLVKKGLDEVGIFPLVPYPEAPISKLYNNYKMDWEEMITGYIPKDYPNEKIIKNFKRKLYFTFIKIILIYHPQKVFSLILNFIQNKQKTKSDRVFKNFIRNIIFNNR